MKQLTVKTLLNRFHPFKGFCYEEVAFIEGSGLVEVYIRPRKNSKGRCSGCHKPGPCYDHLAERRWKFVPFWNIPVLFCYAPRRVDCPRCGVTVEIVPWASGKVRLADAFRLFLAQWARKLSWSEVAERFGVSWHAVYQSVRWVVDYGKANRQLDSVSAIGLDEILVRKGRRFWTLVYQIDEGCRRLLWVGRDRTSNTLRQFFEQMGSQVTQRIQFVCSDMWQPYLEVVREKLPHALCVLDRFHIRQRQNKAIDEIRRQEAHSLARVGLDPLLKNMRWIFLKNRKNWTRKEKRRVRALQTANLRTHRAFILVESFQHFWTYYSPTWAGKFLDRWCKRVNLSKLEPLKTVARTFQQHRELLLNYFRARKEYSSGVVEGFNNKAKVTIKKSYGFKSDNAREVALFHTLGNLPEPSFTHTFF